MTREEAEQELEDIDVLIEEAVFDRDGLRDELGYVSDKLEALREDRAEVLNRLREYQDSE